MASKTCPVCGSVGPTCGGAHAGTTVNPIDVPAPNFPKVGTILAHAVINGNATIVKTSPEEAAAMGWTPFGDDASDPEPRTAGEARHEARTAATAENEKRTVAETPALELDELTVEQLQALAKANKIKGRTRMLKSELVAAIRRAG